MSGMVPTLESPVRTGSVLTVGSVLIMMSPYAQAPVVVLTEGDAVPSSVRLDVFDRREVFVRMRHGERSHGISEPYRLVSRDEYPPDVIPSLVVSSADFMQARFACSASLFGAVDAAVLVPRDETGALFAGVRIPIPSLDQPSWHEFRLNSHSRTECRYTIGGSHAVSPE